MTVRLFNNKLQNQKISKRENIFNSHFYVNETEFEEDYSNLSKTQSNTSDFSKIINKTKYVADIIHHQHILKLIK